jgi:hypothetical protein
MEKNKDETIKPDEFEWKAKQSKFQESLERSSEIVDKWPEWKQNIFGPVKWMDARDIYK